MGSVRGWSSGEIITFAVMVTPSDNVRPPETWFSSLSVRSRMGFSILALAGRYGVWREGRPSAKRNPRELVPRGRRSGDNCRGSRRPPCCHALRRKASGDWRQGYGYHFCSAGTAFSTRKETSQPDARSERSSNSPTSSTFAHAPENGRMAREKALRRACDWSTCTGEGMLQIGPATLIRLSRFLA
jgi:hypothetical protein